MSFLVLNCIFYFRLMQVGDKNVIQAMIDIDETLAGMNITEGNHQEILNRQFDFSVTVMDDQNQWVLYDGYLMMYIIQKFLFTALTLSCPIPGGIFTPTFAIGAVLGQLYVSVLIKILAFFKLSSMI